MAGAGMCQFAPAHRLFVRNQCSTIGCHDAFCEKMSKIDAINQASVKVDRPCRPTDG
jgi:hypothetical protein